MTILQTVAGKLKNAFDLVVHDESSADRKRKGAAAEALITASLPFAKTEDTATYTDTLRAVLLKTRTADIETLTQKGIAVVLEKSLADSKYEGEVKVLGGGIQVGPKTEGAYAPQAQEGAAGGVVSLFDTGKPLKSSKWGEQTAKTYGPDMLQGLAEAVRTGQANAPLVANSYITQIVGDMGMVADAKFVSWALASGEAPAAAAPAAKKQDAPKAA